MDKGTQVKENLNDLRAFLAVAQMGSFTKAAAQLRVSPSALSHSIKGIEERLKIKLFSRTTRSVSTTSAGERLYQELSPLFEQIDNKINGLSELRQTVSGKLRINAANHAIIYALWDKFDAFLKRYPEVELELISDSKFTDIVAERYDAGIRLGESLEKDMIAVRIGDENMKIILVASPEYLAQYGTPKNLEALMAHQCLLVRLPTSGGIMEWEFLDPHAPQKIVSFAPQGRFICSNNFVVRRACLSGHGIAWITVDYVLEDLQQGKLQQILPEWTMNYSGYYLYYPNRRADSPLFQALVKSLRVR